MGGESGNAQHPREEGRRALGFGACQGPAVQGRPEEQALADSARGAAPGAGRASGRTPSRSSPNDDQPSELRIVCTNFECDFTRDRGLPIVAVDEPLYRRLPAFLIATVDKFASLPWVGQAGLLLGGADRADAQGFYGAAEPGKGTRLAAPLALPTL